MPALAPPSSSPRARGLAPRRGFTLVELIVVLALLLMTASLVAPRLASFFRGRALAEEARRVLSLLHHARGEALAAGVPILVWFDPAGSAYGLEAQTGHPAAGEVRPLRFSLDPSIRLEVPAAPEMLASEQEEEKLGLPADRLAIRFQPDGVPDDAAPERVRLVQEEAVREIALRANRLGYEIRMADARP